MINFFLYYLSMSIKNTIWHVFYHFLPFFVLFSCYIFTNDWLNLSQGHQIVLIISFVYVYIYIYISMLIDNVTWHARVGMFYALKLLLKSKSSTRYFSELFSLTFILCIILLHLNNVHLFFNCILITNTKTYLRLLTKLPKMTKIAIFLLFWL